MKLHHVKLVQDRVAGVVMVMHENWQGGERVLSLLRSNSVKLHAVIETRLSQCTVLSQRDVPQGACKALAYTLQDLTTLDGGMTNTTEENNIYIYIYIYLFNINPLISRSLVVTFTFLSFDVTCSSEILPHLC